jgi:hypothetical protein
VGGKFRAYSAAKAAGYAFRPFILRIRHAQEQGSRIATAAHLNYEFATIRLKTIGYEAKRVVSKSARR